MPFLFFAPLSNFCLLSIYNAEIVAAIDVWSACVRSCNFFQVLSCSLNTKNPARDRRKPAKFVFVEGYGKRGGLLAATGSLCASDLEGSPYSHRHNADYWSSSDFIFGHRVLEQLARSRVHVCLLIFSASSNYRIGDRVV